MYTNVNTNTANQEAAALRARRDSRGGKRGRRFLLALLAIAVVYLLANREALERLLPIEWFREAAPVTGLHPTVAEKRDQLIAQSRKLGIDVLITDDFRSSEEQDALYRQGRSKEGPIVTQVKGGGSYHNYGLAIDFALRTSDGDVLWDIEYDGNGNGKADWMEVVSLAKKLGFTWGGDWEGFPDYPHLQMDFGYSIGELQRGWRPSVP
ncbi:M15 family metallopeptidase [Cohnella boryungensis]|uniref:M15 family metallopeptidase n=1 Tax=Cohnella boryungensis TaxID=768479 RepID=A0ABV8SKT6_9BACL